MFPCPLGKQESPERLRIRQRNGAKRSPDRLHGQMPSRGRLRDCAGRDGADTICGDLVCERKQSKRGLVKIATKDGTEVCGQRIRERDSQDGLRAARLPTQAAQGGRAFLFREREREMAWGVCLFLGTTFFWFYRKPKENHPCAGGVSLFF